MTPKESLNPCSTVCLKIKHGYYDQAPVRFAPSGTRLPMAQCSFWQLNALEDPLARATQKDQAVEVTRMDSAVA